MLTHPYYPLGAEIPNYMPNESPTLNLVLTFGLSLAASLAASWAVLQPSRRGCSVLEAAIVMWFILCGTLHIGFEGYYVLHFKILAGKQTVLAQLWKEYALSDSRYLTQDVQVLCLEIISTIVWGPLSLLTASWTVRRDPRRHILQTIVSVAHLYGVVLYYSTSFADLYIANKSYSRPEPLFFWGYFIGANAPWVVVPAYIIYRCLNEATQSVANIDRKPAAL